MNDWGVACRIAMRNGLQNLISDGVPDSRLQAISSKWEALEAAAVVLAHVLGVAVSPKLLSIL